MQHLIPDFIYEKHLEGEQTGELAAATLFLDVVGFTALTQNLMQHGNEGAEVMASIINQVYVLKIKIHQVWHKYEFKIP